LRFVAEEFGGEPFVRPELFEHVQVSAGRVSLLLDPLRVRGVHPLPVRLDLLGQIGGVDEGLGLLRSGDGGLVGRARRGLGRIRDGGVPAQIVRRVHDGRSDFVLGHENPLKAKGPKRLVGRSALPGALR
jgi:hypothetical protein